MAAAEWIERHVEEVHCVDCGAPMPSIPGWYASVKVRFSCDVCRQKSPRLAAAPVLDAVAPAAAVVADTDVDPVGEEADLEADTVEDLEIEVDDSEIVETGED